jgi:glycosyltransferase involved in cell wall biosynthesis
VLDRETGLLSPEGDVPALATNIALLLASQELRERLGNAARKRVERDFDVRRQTALLETIYDDVVAEATR